MIDFASIRTSCEKASTISKALIDDYLIYYVAHKDNLDRDFETRIAAYRHITSEIQKSWVNLLKAQYMAHRLFRENGLAKKYIKHRDLQHLKPEEIDFLDFQINNPWRFSFSIITANPEVNFFQMKDVFTGDSFLLYSPGISSLVKEQGAILWFNLIAFNGSCWQTFGPIGAYNGFDSDDIFFYATELHPHLEVEEDIVKDIEQNPIPYSMLIIGAALPLVFHKKNQLALHQSEHSLDSFSTDGLSAFFTIEYNKSVYRLTMKKWGEYPHYSVAYYDEKKRLLVLTSMTERGFDELVKKLNALGYSLPGESDVRVTLTMISTAGKILKRKIRLNQYESHFEIKRSPQNQEGLAKLNVFMALALQEINTGQEPDVDMLAKKAGVDSETAREFLSIALKKVGQVRGAGM
jgi:hypothetical protein